MEIAANSWRACARFNWLASLDIPEHLHYLSRKAFPAAVLLTTLGSQAKEEGLFEAAKCSEIFLCKKEESNEKYVAHSLQRFTRQVREVSFRRSRIMEHKHTRKLSSLGGPDQRILPHEQISDGITAASSYSVLCKRFVRRDLSKSFYRGSGQLAKSLTKVGGMSDVLVKRVSLWRGFRHLSWESL